MNKIDVIDIYTTGKHPVVDIVKIHIQNDVNANTIMLINESIMTNIFDLLVRNTRLLINQAILLNWNKDINLYSNNSHAR